MRKLLIGCFAFFLMSSVEAMIPIDSITNRVSLQFTAEQWVTTKNPLVNITINASVNDSSLDKTQASVLEKLAKLSKSEWHIISYDQSPDKSGLENVKLVAQSRMSESDLTGLRERAKSMSKPGETFTVDKIDFTPSEEENRNAMNTLRENIYTQIQNEITRLNKVYPDQKYYAHEISFGFDSMPMPMAYSQNMMMKSQAGSMPTGIGGISTFASDSASQSQMTVGNKLRLNANVILSTQPDPNILKVLER